MIRVLAWSAALAVVLVLGFVAALFVERWANLRRERAEKRRIEELEEAAREELALGFGALMAGDSNVVSLTRRRGQ